MSPEPVSPEQLADAYWGNYLRRTELEKAQPPRPYDAATGDKIVARGDGWQLIAHKRREVEPEEPETGLEWAWDMVNHIACGDPWEDEFAVEEQREPRLAPRIERLDLLELLAARAPGEDALGFLGADAVESYLGASPDIDAVDRVAQRTERFRRALASAWYDAGTPRLPITPRR